VILQPAKRRPKKYGTISGEGFNSITPLPRGLDYVFFCQLLKCETSASSTDTSCTGEGTIHDSTNRIAVLLGMHDGMFNFEIFINFEASF